MTFAHVRIPEPFDLYKENTHLTQRETLQFCFEKHVMLSIDVLICMGLSDLVYEALYKNFT